jgi:putative nucleotidyltransferase with HDIG domain
MVAKPDEADHMLVHVVGDTRARISAVCSMLEQTCAVTSELLGGASIRNNSTDAVIVTADLCLLENISAVKAAFGEINRVPRRIFLVDQSTRLAFVQACALGATHVLTNPVSQVQLLNKLIDGDASAIVQCGPASGGREAASAGAACIASMFSAVMSGSPVDIAGAKAAGSKIADSIAEDGLSNWLTTVRRHHEGTYQHCLLVTGVAVDFGLSLGMAKADVERLYSAAMFHDIGKARIPLTVLDKPGRLDDRERALIETQPTMPRETAYEILLDMKAKLERPLVEAFREVALKR